MDTAAIVTELLATPHVAEPIVAAYTERMRYLPVFLLAFALLPGCGAPPVVEDAPESVEVPQHVNFEQRMAIRARLTRIRSEAREEAAVKHDRFASEEEAVAFQRLSERLQAEKRDALKQEYDVTDAELNAIVDEYLQNQGVRLNQ